MPSRGTLFKVIKARAASQLKSLYTDYTIMAVKGLLLLKSSRTSYTNLLSMDCNLKRPLNLKELKEKIYKCF